MESDGKESEKMLSGIYTAASGMAPRYELHQVMANNLANVSTTGFKRDKLYFHTIRQAIPSGDPRRLTTGDTLGVDVMYTNHEQGELTPTGNDLDVGLLGNGFFVVKTPNGVRYTRAGNFTLDNRGRLVTFQGDPVLDEGSSEIELPAGKVMIDLEGNIQVNNELISRLAVVDFADRRQLYKEGHNYFAVENGAGRQARSAEAVEVRQFMLENSNVKAVEEMVDMVSVVRNYETSQKSIQLQDETLNKAVNEVGRLA